MNDEGLLIQDIDFVQLSTPGFFYSSSSPPCVMYLCLISFHWRCRNMLMSVRGSSHTNKKVMEIERHTPRFMASQILLEAVSNALYSTNRKLSAHSLSGCEMS